MDRMRDLFNFGSLIESMPPTLPGDAKGEYAKVLMEENYSETFNCNSIGAFECVLMEFIKPF